MTRQRHSDLDRRRLPLLGLPIHPDRDVQRRVRAFDILREDPGERVERWVEIYASWKSSYFDTNSGSSGSTGSEGGGGFGLRLLADCLGTIVEDSNGRRWPKIQILTAQDLLDGKLPQMRGAGTRAPLFAKARRERSGEQRGFRELPFEYDSDDTVPNGEA